MAKPRVRKLLELRTDTPEFLEALDALAVIQEGSANASNSRRDARRHLRYDLEDRSLKLIEAFVEEATKVSENLTAVKAVVTNLGQQCSSALEDLELAEKATTKFVEESSALREQRKQAEARAEMVSAFLQRFQLAPGEIEALNRTFDGRSDPDAEFFKSLEHVRKIRDECGELLSGAHQNAGIEIFEQMAGYQTKAQDIVYAWIKREASEGNVGRDLESEMKRQLYSKAFVEFKLSSPAYYSDGVELISRARRGEVTRKFTQALQNKQHDMIMASVGDPVRLVTDLMTSLHEICAEERDLYQTVFHNPVGVSTFRGGVIAFDDVDASAFSSSTKSNALDPAEQQESLERALGGTSAILKSRLSQLLENTFNSVACFRSVQVLDFYSEILSTFFPLQTTNSEEDNPLLIVKYMREEANERFFKLVEDKANELALSARTRALPGADLSASLEVLELVRSLRDILSSIRDHSLMSSNRSNSLEETSKALKAFVTPIRSLVANADSTFSNPADASIFAVNNLAALQAVLTLHEFTAPLVEELTFEIGERIDILARIRSNNALGKTGLIHALGALERVTDKSKLADQPGLRAEQVKAIFDAFYRDLSVSLVMPEFDRIDAPRLRQEARNATCALVLNAHNRLYDAIKEGGYSETSFLIYNKEQVADLLL